MVHVVSPYFKCFLSQVGMVGNELIFEQGEIWVAAFFEGGACTCKNRVRKCYFSTPQLVLASALSI